MFRIQLLCAASVMAATCVGTASMAQTTGGSSPSTIASGGSNLVSSDIVSELSTFDPNGTIFSTGYPAPANQYYTQNSAAGVNALIYDNILCLVNGAVGSKNVCGISPNDTNPNTAAGGTNSVRLADTDSIVTLNDWAVWNGTYTGTNKATTAHGQSTAGNLIQIPSVGTPVTIVIKNASVTANGQVNLTDDDLCGIFSGKITDWSQTSAAGSLTPGAITVVYRADASGTTRYLAAHFAQVCNSSNSNFPNALIAGASGQYSAMNNPQIWNPTGTTRFPETHVFGDGTFASLFTNGVTGNTVTASLPTGALAENGPTAEATTLQGQTSAIGYSTPDYTSISQTGGSSGANNYGLVVASVNGVIPTVANTQTALMHAGAHAYNTTVPSATTATQLGAWVPVTPLVTSGYPIVGYSTFVFPQCFASSTMASNLISFLNDHYTSSTYTTIQANAGFVPLGSVLPAEVTAIQGNILANSSWNYGIDNSTACSGKPGR